MFNADARNTKTKEVETVKYYGGGNNGIKAVEI